ncbi:MAG: 1-deoxy-D-xylulose-5-phosphate synthase [Austwickia sp.]|nr:1-deoxy-D-xylulose-5-phosphate synthase [Austwickia sp.]MBK8435517.1 1-deoxy-D-xylulose-5-phosphate synthase [Austwickia sp.]MBK9100911.1 1-deoxy-D-xylulose-5-phosphate synthase [Austwickia sp.]
MTDLHDISRPEDLQGLDDAELAQLADSIRRFLVSSVSRTGGHLGPNLGVVELTIALHRVFRSPHDTVVFDTGHISYVHKLLTGRQDFDRLRQRGGLSGYPSRAESVHDVVENSHASTSLSWAEGIAKGRRLRGETDRRTVAVIGDGALTGGMAWEALNNISADHDLPLVIVVNDNARSYGRTIGGLSEHLATLRTARQYEQLMTWGRATLAKTPVVGQVMFDALHGVKKGLKDIMAPQGLFEDLGMKYLGPVDGHDIRALEVALRQAAGYGAPVIVHVLTKKGQGYEPARAHADDRFHAVGVINPETGLPLEVSGRSWTDEFSAAVETLGEQRTDIVALTAAMLIPVGLKGFAQKFPDRVYDVGIAEQHAVTMACGLAFAGLHPVVAIYSTFLNRAFDQVLLDCAMHRAGVTFILDRAGITGNDGASHNGMWDLALVSLVPGVRLAAPRDAARLRAAVTTASEIADGPSVVRFAKGNPPPPQEPVRRVGTAVEGTPVDGTVGVVDVLAEPHEGGVDDLIVALGPMTLTAVGVADRLAQAGRSVRVVDPVWALPVPAALLDLAVQSGRVITLEDGLVRGGFGAMLSQHLQEAGIDVPVRSFGVPQAFLEHASRGEVLEAIGLTPQGIADRLVGPVEGSRVRVVSPAEQTA